MAGWISFVLIATAPVIAMTESRILPAQPISIMLDTYDNPVIFLREKRMAVHPYPQRAMMFTGYYRPVRRSNNGGQATGVFAQGNAVSGEAFFGGLHTPHLKSGPEPIEEPEVSSAEAQAAPAFEETYNEEEQEKKQPAPVYQTHHQEEQHRHSQEEDEQFHHGNHQHHHYHQQDSPNSQEHQEPEQIPLTTEAVQPVEQTVASVTEVSTTRSKTHHTKKTQKTPIVVDADDDDEDEIDEEDDEPVVPFVPFKGNKRRQGYPNLNNFFPMVFSFPRVAARAGSPGSPPGAITAIANSYSTGKGGVASSVATAYGGSPTGKKRRAQPSDE